MTVFLPVFCAAGGQHEEHTVYGNPVRDEVNKKSAETQATQRNCIMGYSNLDNGYEVRFLDFALDEG